MSSNYVPIHQVTINGKIYGKTPAPAPQETPNIPVESMNTTNTPEPLYRGYIKHDNTYIPTSYSVKKMSSGVYKINYNGNNWVFEKIDTETDDLIRFNDSVNDLIISEVEKFWTLGDVFKKEGFIHKRGFLLYGPPGGGKTATVQLIIDDIIKRNGIAIMFNCDPNVFINLVTDVRKTQPDTPIVCIFEDIDTLIDRFGESEVLSFLDGEQNINKIINIATTNYPERLDGRVANRARRFDTTIGIGMPAEKTRKEYFIHKMPDLSEQEIEEWVDVSHEYSFAELSELIILVRCFGHSLEDAAKKISDLKSNHHSKNFKASGVGFLVN